jgi:hypothetical protein
VDWSLEKRAVMLGLGKIAIFLGGNRGSFAQALL